MQQLARQLEAHIQRLEGSDVHVVEVEPLAGGACQESFVVEVEIGGKHSHWVLRSDAPGSLPGSLARRAEAIVQQAAHDAGVTTPAVRWPGEDVLRPGASAYFMEYVAGTTLGRKVVAAVELAESRARLCDQLARELAAIHQIRPTAGPPISPPWQARASDVGAVASALALHRQALDNVSTPRPALELGLAWLEDHRPEENQLCLCHGDFRTGNFVIDPGGSGLLAILDWEFARYSDPLDDLGWLCVRDWRFGELERPAFGLCSREDLYDAYRRAGGIEVDPEAAHYWEVMGNLRWAIGAVYQGERYRCGEDDIELFAIGRRAIEIEYELLRLIERGPS